MYVFSSLIFRAIKFFTKDPYLMDLAVLRQRNAELNVKLMRTSAEASEAKEKLARWQTEIEVLRDQRGHNLCHIGVPRLLKTILGTSEPYPDTEGITPEQFANGCVNYHADIFGKCGIRLQVVKDDKTAAV